MYDALIIGAGHNGLVCGTVLARAGMEVLIVEANDEAGGCIWTETLPSGHRIERGAIDHGAILPLVDELGLSEFGLEYMFREVVVGAGFGDGTTLLFHQDLGVTLEAIATHAPADVAGYEEMSRVSSHLLEMMGTFDRPPSLADLSSFGANLATDPLWLLLTSADKAIGRYVTDDHLRSAIAMYGAHGQLPPWLPGTGLFGLLLPAVHGKRVGRPKGGSQALTMALEAALRGAGGALRTGTPICRIDNAEGGGVATTADGEGIPAHNIVSTIDVAITTALFESPPAALTRVAQAVTSGALNVAELKVDLALSEPASPGFDGDPAALWLLQEHPDSLRRSFAQLISGEMPDDPCMMWAAPSALDSTAAPSGQGTVWLSAFVPARPRTYEWDAEAEQAAGEWLLDGFARITGRDLRPSVVDMRVTGPASWERRIGSRYGNPNHIDLTIDQLFTWRPPTTHPYRTDLPWLYLSGAGTHPGGGLSGIPGRNAARAVLADAAGYRGRRRRWKDDLSAMREGWRLFRALRKTS
ncbi:MAG: NAD(P)/FAD-dependent oxidoreductase [Acidimicrobiia bacterium]